LDEQLKEVGNGDCCLPQLVSQLSTAQAWVYDNRLVLVVPLGRLIAANGSSTVTEAVCAGLVLPGKEEFDVFPSC